MRVFPAAFVCICNFFLLVLACGAFSGLDLEFSLDDYVNKHPQEATERKGLRLGAQLFVNQMQCEQAFYVLFAVHASFMCFISFLFCAPINVT